MFSPNKESQKVDSSSWDVVFREEELTTPSEQAINHWCSDLWEDWWEIFGGATYNLSKVGGTTSGSFFRLLFNPDLSSQSMSSLQRTFLFQRWCWLLNQFGCPSLEYLPVLKRSWAPWARLLQFPGQRRQLSPNEGYPRSWFPHLPSALSWADEHSKTFGTSTVLPNVTRLLYSTLHFDKRWMLTREDHPRA